MKIKVVNQRLYLEPPETAEGTREYLKAEFSFSEEWDGMTKMAFSRGAGNTYSQLLKDDACTVPTEALAAPGRVGVSVSGTLGETVITTDIKSFTLPDTFKNILISHRMFSDGSWGNTSVDIMNEVMVHGTYICTDNNNRQTSDTQQLALFRLAPELKAIGVNYWLRNVAGSQTYTLISQYGDASSDMATSTYGIRPVFAIG